MPLNSNIVQRVYFMANKVAHETTEKNKTNCQSFYFTEFHNKPRTLATKDIAVYLKTIGVNRLN